MCGIAGIVAVDGAAEMPTVAQLRRMAGALVHRGPDEFGVYRDERAGLAHARLSIIDLSHGQQPLCNEDETLWIAYNGEVFNYVELREELIAHGHRFRTASDTEVIVHAYEQWGLEAFARFNGQFAIALWDSKTGSLVLARDPVGIRPLYVCHHHGRVYFASEIKALFASEPSMPRELDPDGLAQSFTFWSVLAPQGVFRGVQELMPGTVRVYRGGEVRDERFWEPHYPIGAEGRFDASLEEATEAVRAALEEATRLRMLRADVPVGSYLSGGLDSSLVAAMAKAAKGDSFQTFSLRFQDQEYDETSFQRMMVERLGTQHHEVVVTRRDIAEVFPTVIRHTERPILRTAPAPLLLLSRLVHQIGIKVVLTGEGADEMFAGYDLFREGKVRRFWAKEPESKTRPLLLQRLYPYLARSPVAQQAMARKFFGRDLASYREPGFSHGPRWHSTTSVRRLLRSDVRQQIESRDLVGELVASLPDAFSSWTPLAQDQYLEVRTLMSSYILASQGDRMLMANSVEGRFSFLDPDVMALANSLPDAYKLKVLDEKHVLKRVSRDLVPPEIMQRPKQPYRAPDAMAFVPAEGEPPEDWIEDVLSDAALHDAAVFEPKAAQTLWKKCRARSDATFSNADNMALTGLLSTQLLHAHFVREGWSHGYEPALDTLVNRVPDRP